MTLTSARTRGVERRETCARGASLTLLLAAICSGCSTIKTEIGTVFDLSELDSLPIGVATRQQVMAEHGPPLALTPQGDGVAFLYEYVDLSEQQFGISLKSMPYLAPWLGRLFKAVIGYDTTEHHAAVLFFDRHGLLTEVHSGSWPELPGRGFALQFFAEVKPVVNVEAYLRSPLLMEWGYVMLEPPNQAQNQVYRAPVEMRGSPENAGQRSLEILRVP